jgi:spore germination protein YaaH
MPTASVCIPVAPSGRIAYRIQYGDTLSELAMNTGTSMDRVLIANCSESASRIVVNTRIYLPRQPIPSETTATEAPEQSRTLVPTRQSPTGPERENRNPPTYIQNRDNAEGEPIPTEAPPTRRG